MQDQDGQNNNFSTGVLRLSIDDEIYFFHVRHKRDFIIKFKEENIILDWESNPEPLAFECKLADYYVIHIQIPV